MSKRIYPVTVENGELVESNEKLTVNGLPISKDGTIDSSYVSGSGSSEWEVDANGNLVPVDGEPVSVGSLSSDEVLITNETLVVASQSADQALSAGTFATITLDTVAKDELSEFDTANHAFVPNETGYYIIQGMVSTDGGASGDSLIGQFRDVDSPRTYVQYAANRATGGDQISVAFSGIRELTAGNQHKIRFRNNDSSDTTVSADFSTYLTIRRAFR